MQPLNPKLYATLRQAFGEVQIVNPGRRMVPCYRPRDVYRPTFGSNGTAAPPALKRTHTEPGEEYLLEVCPYCDGRWKLSVNHTYGCFDPKLGSRHYGLWHCYKGHCEQDPANSGDFRLMVDLGGSCGALPYRPAESVEIDAEDALVEASLPYGTRRINELRESHRANAYLRRRGFDPWWLATAYGVGYCGGGYWGDHGRIVIPIRMLGRLVGWQARSLGASDDGPKYYTCPGMPLRYVAYGYDRAIKYRTVVIVEGPTDAWRTGTQAMALLGKSKGDWLLRRLQRDLSDDATVVIALDPVQPRREVETGREHHIERLYQRLVAAGKAWRRRVARVYLTSGRHGKVDPGRMRRAEIWEQIATACAEQRVACRREV